MKLRMRVSEIYPAEAKHNLSGTYIAPISRKETLEYWAGWTGGGWRPIGKSHAPAIYLDK